MLFLLIGLFLGGASVEQVHFNACEKVHFVGSACDLDRALCMKGKDTQRCNPPAE